MATIGACVYFGFFYLSLFVCQPIHYLMKAILALYSYTLYMISIKRR